MAFTAGEVLVRLGAHVDPDGFRKYDREVEQAQRKKAVETALKGDYDPKAFSQYEKALNESRQRAERQKAFKAHLGGDYDAKAFRQYERALAEGRREGRRGIVARLRGDYDRRGFQQFDRATKDADRNARRVGAGASVGGRGLRLFSVGATAVTGALIGGAGLTAALGFMARQTGQAQVANAKLTGVLKSMGAAAPASRKQIESLTDSISKQTGEDDELVKTSLTVLATFKGLGTEQARHYDIFNRSSRAVKGLSLVFGVDMNRAAIQVGKAMNDPVKGMTALNRQGVTFTDSQRKVVKAWVDQGKTGKAQNFIMREIEQQTGKVSREYGRSLPAALGRAKTEIGNLAERYGNKLAPSVDKALRKVTQFVRQMESGKGAGGRFRRTLEDIWQSAKPIVTWIGRAIVNVAKFAGEHKTVTKLAVAIGAAAIAVNAIKTNRAVAGIGTLLSGLRRLARTKAGEQAQSAIVEGMSGLWARLRGGVRRAGDALADTLGRFGKRGGSDAVGGTVGNLDKGKGRFAAAGTRAGRLIGKAISVGAILGMAALGGLIADKLQDVTNNVINPWIEKHLGPGGSILHKLHDLFPSTGKQLNPFARQHGGVVAPGETTLVGEAGPEIAQFPAGTRIIPNDKMGDGLAETLAKDRQRARKPLADIGKDLVDLAAAGRRAGRLTARGITDQLESGGKQSKVLSRKLNRDVAGQLDDMQKDAGRHTRRMRDRTAGDFEDIRRSGGRETKRLARGTAGDFEDIRRSGGRETKRLARGVTGDFDDMRAGVAKHMRNVQRTTSDRMEAARKGAGRGARGVRQVVANSYESMDRAVQRGLGYVQTATANAMDGLGGKAIKLNVPKPKGLASGRPSFMVDAPSRQDSALYALGRDEAVLNVHHQDEINSILAMFGTSVNDVIRRVVRPNYAASGKPNEEGDPPKGRSHWDRLIAAMNELDRRHLTYQFGGGHVQPAWGTPSFDCSGMVSYAVQHAGYRVPTVASGAIGGWGFPGGGGKAEIYYNPGHTFMGVRSALGKVGRAAAGRGGYRQWGSNWMGWGGGHTTGGFSTVHLPNLGKAGIMPGGMGEDAPSIPRILVKGADPLRQLAQRAINKVRGRGNQKLQELMDENAAGAGLGAGPPPANFEGSITARATSYGPPWGGIQGGGVTATGVNLRGNPHLHGVAVDPSVIPLRSRLRIWPNPFGYRGAFSAFDTGGAIKGHRIDFYDWRGRRAQNGWGMRTVKIDPAARGKPAVGRTGMMTAAGGALTRRAGRGVTKLKADIEDLGTAFELKNRRFDLTEEEFVNEGDDNTPPSLNMGAIKQRAGELGDLIKIRQRIVRKYKRLLDYLRSLIRVYTQMEERLIRSIESVKGSLKRLRGRKGKEAKRTRNTLEDRLDKYTKALKGARSRKATYNSDLTEQGFEAESANIDVDELVKERAPLLASIAGRPGGVELPEWSPPDTGSGDTSGGAAASPAEIAQQALEQLQTFTQNRADLFAGFGRNFAVAGSNPFATVTGQAAGARFFGAAGGGDSPDPWLARAGGGGFVVAGDIHNHFDSAPENGQTWIEQQKFHITSKFG